MIPEHNPIPCVSGILQTVLPMITEHPGFVRLMVVVEMEMPGSDKAVPMVMGYPADHEELVECAKHVVAMVGDDRDGPTDSVAAYIYNGGAPVHINDWENIPRPEGQE